MTVGRVRAVQRKGAGRVVTRGSDVATWLSEGPEASGRPSLLIWTGAFCYVVVSLGSIHLLRKVVLLLPVLVIVAAIAHWRTRPQAVRGAVPIALFAYLSWLLISYSWSGDHHDSGHQILETLLVAAAAWLLACNLSKEDVLRIVAMATRFFIAVTTVTLVGAHHYATKPAVDGAPGWHGPFGHKNDFGFAMALGLLALYYERPRPRHLALWLVAGVILLLGSQSGASLAITMIAATIVLWLETVGRVHRKRDRLAVVLISVVAVGGGIFFLLTDFPAAAAILGKNSTLTGRTKIWSVVANAAGSNLVHGFGYAGVWLNTTGETALLWSRIGFHAFEAHNTWLDLLLQLGAVGLVLMVLALLGALSRVGKGLIGAAPANRWLFLSLLAIIIEGVVESDLTGDGMFFVTLLVTASLVKPVKCSVAPVENGRSGLLGRSR